ncbi:MAG: S-methyl-5-thioribose-1-phosphate isomerase [Chitinophagales bacterium]|nr:S-methyl-5-thioribose-1-phosphate isomerase [Chitinophagales bacterium]
MLIDGQHYRTIWLKNDDPTVVQIIDQRNLPHEFNIEDLRSLEEAARAIKEMHVRGAPLIGSTAAYGMYLALLNTSEEDIQSAAQSAANILMATRPTAVNLAHAVQDVLAAISGISDKEEAVSKALETAHLITESSVSHCRSIGEHGLELFRQIQQKKGVRVPINVLTHCNAGWIACIDYGTATAPIYAAHKEGINVHVWVDETRPRNQGARITAYELAQQGIPHTVITDNSGGHLMQHGMVDLVIVGADRVTRQGDAANKIGTYLKALAAADNDIPFYVALPSSTLDFQLRDGVKEIPIEERNSDEVHYIQGWYNGRIYKVRLTPFDSPAGNHAFDVTPARLIDGLITERGICEASEDGIMELFPEQKLLITS